MLAVIGHGPSLHGSGLGEYIDSFKYVMRLPYLNDWQVPIDYGVRTSYVCSSSGGQLSRIGEKRPDIGFYIWNKVFGHPVTRSRCRNLGIKEYEDVSGLIQKWAKKLPKPFQNLSSGTAAILIAASKVGESITVFGCDYLKIGKDMRDGYIGSWFYDGRIETWKNILKTGAHALDEERKLIDEMEQQYGVRIEFK